MPNYSCLNLNRYNSVLKSIGLGYLRVWVSEKSGDTCIFSLRCAKTTGTFSPSRAISIWELENEGQACSWNGQTLQKSMYVGISQEGLSYNSHVQWFLTTRSIINQLTPSLYSYHTSSYNLLQRRLKRNVFEIIHNVGTRLHNQNITSLK